MYQHFSLKRHCHFTVPFATAGTQAPVPFKVTNHQLCRCSIFYLYYWFFFLFLNFMIFFIAFSLTLESNSFYYFSFTSLPEKNCHVISSEKIKNEASHAPTCPQKGGFSCSWWWLYLMRKKSARMARLKSLSTWQNAFCFHANSSFKGSSGSLFLTLFFKASLTACWSWRKLHCLNWKQVIFHAAALCGLQLCL